MGKKFSNNQIVGVILLVALVLLFVPLPLIDGRSIAAICLLGCAVYMFVRK
jgi:hypothetical protein